MDAKEMYKFPKILGNLATDVKKIYLWENFSWPYRFDSIPDVLCIDYDMYIIICMPTVKLLEFVVALLLEAKMLAMKRRTAQNIHLHI